MTNVLRKNLVMFKSITLFIQWSKKIFFKESLLFLIIGMAVQSHTCKRTFCSSRTRGGGSQKRNMQDCAKCFFLPEACWLDTLKWCNLYLSFLIGLIFNKKCEQHRIVKQTNKLSLKQSNLLKHHTWFFSLIAHYLTVRLSGQDANLTFIKDPMCSPKLYIHVIYEKNFNWGSKGHTIRIKFRDRLHKQ